MTTDSRWLTLEQRLRLIFKGPVMADIAWKDHATLADELLAERGAEIARLRELVDEAYRLLKHKGMLTKGHQERLEAALEGGTKA